MLAPPSVIKMFLIVTPLMGSMFYTLAQVLVMLVLNKFVRTTLINISKLVYYL
jgi:hypothetical protein